MENWFHGEALKDIFPLLEGKDLISCMLVCHQWRDIAKDDYFWKCICTRKWPSISKIVPPGTTFHRLFTTFSQPPPPRQQPLPLPNLSFEDLVFYVDVWTEEKEILLSSAVSGSVLRAGLTNVPNGIAESLRSHMDSPDCKMMMPVNPSVAIAYGNTATVSVLVSRRDTNKMARVANRAIFDYVDVTASRALAYEYLRFSPRRPFISDIRVWVSLLFQAGGGHAILEVFGVEIDFCDAATTEVEFLWLLDMLDWK
ncbi:F-box protein [Carex littledalei]|uniref:F-box protein n=1 Tax=Carex littledalei TaxID=544730 RepID=A0A833QLU7_9POAL|nr:F-box protein [Carex littledalei]